jgi:hypothetical protein
MAEATCVLSLGVAWYRARIRRLGGSSLTLMQAGGSTHWHLVRPGSGQVRFITRPKSGSRTMRAKRKKRLRANRTKVPN